MHGVHAMDMKNITTRMEWKKSVQQYKFVVRMLSDFFFTRFLLASSFVYLFFFLNKTISKFCV